ncbi:MAG: flagellar hook-associated protein FlgK [Burkholderiales bacterium]
MANGIFGVGLSGLNAAQLALLTAGHNISNAATPGYTRQQTVQVSSIPQLTGAGFIGKGVQVATIKRIYDEFLTRQVAQAQTQASQLDAYYAQIKQIDNILGDPSSGLSPALQGFFSGVDDVAANPSAVPSRQALLSSAQSLVSRFRALDQRFAEIRSGINSQIVSSIAAINSLAQQVAGLNHTIMVAESASGVQQANDLRDQREQLVAELNKEVAATVVKQGDGSYNVFIGNGQALVVGNNALKLAATASPADPSRMMIGYASSGGTVLVPEASLSGGSLGGYLAFRNETLDAAQNALGRIAIGLAQTFNDQHRLGQDLDGALGGDFFKVPVPKVVANSGNNPAHGVAASITSVGALTASDYSFGFDGTNYTLTRLADGTKTSTATAPSAAAPLVFDGISVSISSGPLAAGESFLIQPTRNGARDLAVAISDTSKVAAAAPLRTAAALGNAGTAQIGAGAVNGFNDKVVISFTSGTAFDVVDSTTGAVLAKNMAYVSGGTISFNGWTTQISGAPVAGDTFSIDRLLASTTSGTATIANASPNSPSPVDSFLTNGVRVVFDSATTFHLEGTTNNISGGSSITGGTFAPPIGTLADGANAGITVTGAAAAIGSGGVGAYTSSGVKTTVSGGTIAGVGSGTITISGATLTVEGGSYYGSTTFKGMDITIDEASGAITIPAAGGGATASTFHARPATAIAYDNTVSNPLSVNGWSAAISGNAVAGDVFTIGANSGGISDNRNALLLAALRDSKPLLGGSATYQAAYGQLVSSVGNKSRELDVTSKAQANLVAQTEQALQALSGVNIDEEAANLLRYQQIYQAAGKLMQIADSLFGTVLDLGR